MNEPHQRATIDDREPRRRDLWWLLLLLLLSFGCLFLSSEVARLTGSQRTVMANMLSAGVADYGFSTPLAFAPIDPAIATEALTDILGLTVTPGSNDEPVSVVSLPVTPTPTKTPLPTFTASPTPSPMVLTTPLPSATRTPRSPATHTPSPPTSTPAVATATPISPAATATTTTPATTAPTSTPVNVPPTATPPPPTVHPTPTPPPSTDTPAPTNTPTASATPTATFTPTPTATLTPTPTLPAPLVLAISPTQGMNTSTVSVVITGSNFVAGVSAMLNAGLTYPINVGSSTASQILGTVPTGVFSGTYALRVTNPDLQSAQLTGAYTATNSFPQITAITPTMGLTSSTTPVTIAGDYFVEPVGGDLDGYALTNVTYVSSALLTAEVPSNLMPTGIFSLTITNPGPTSPASTLPNAFTVASSPRDLKAAGSDGLVSLGWLGSTPSPQNYEIQVTTDIVSPAWASLPPTTSTLAYHLTATNGITHWYRVRAQYPGGEVSGFSNVATATPMTISVTLPVSVTCSITDVVACDNALAIDAPGTPSNSDVGLTLVYTNGAIVLDYGPGEGIVDGPGPDLLFYERATASQAPIPPPPQDGLWMDFSRIEISPDATNWTLLFEWNGDDVPGQDVANSDIACFADDTCDLAPADYPGEAEHNFIPASALWADLDGPPSPPWNTGIGIDLAGVAESGVQYRYVRFTRPAGGTPSEPTDVDAIYRLN